MTQDTSDISYCWFGMEGSETHAYVLNRYFWNVYTFRIDYKA